MGNEHGKKDKHFDGGNLFIELAGGQIGLIAGQWV
jgi:hypothetical protein